MGIKHTMQISVLDNLFQQREKEIKHAIGNLSINDVKEDGHFHASINRIKSRAILTPVTIGDPVIKNNRQEMRQVPSNYQMIFGGERAVNIVTVEFPVTGSHELFEYRANGGSLTLSNVYTPDYNSISMDIEVPALDKVQVMAAASKEINTTRELIAQNNPHAEAWSQQIGNKIDAIASAKRKELLDFYN
ncbi:MAG: hypothetical protein JST70_14045 [Bacteroidetes bacterium]|nr:hypothetical protein [Bacteroidota bacterium]